MTKQEFIQDLIEWLKQLNADRKNGKRLPIETGGNRISSKVVDGKKICSYCKKWFPCTTEYFIADKAKKCGVKSYCKECNRIKDKIYKMKRKSV